MNKELVPCPFCGSEDGPEVSLFNGTIPRGWVMCTNCGALGPVSYEKECPTSEELIESSITLWNKRILNGS